MGPVAVILNWRTASRAALPTAGRSCRGRRRHRRAAARGAFDWPVPTVGLDAVERFRRESREWPRSIPVAFPRFVDIYAQANVHASWGRIEDEQSEIVKLVDDKKEPGRYEYLWQTKNIASGVYIYRLQAGDFSQVKKMVLIN